MKFIRLIILGVIAFFTLVTAFSLFIPSHVRISRATNLAPGSDSILRNIGDLNNWKNWHPQFEKLTLSDEQNIDGRVVSAIVNGVRLSVKTFSDTLVSVEMQKGKYPVMNNWKLIRYPHNDSLTIQNYMDFDFNWYPWEKFSSLLLEGTYGHVMEEGLKNLKSFGK